MRFALPLLALLALQCAPTVPKASSADGAPPDAVSLVDLIEPPLVAVVGDRLLVTFRGLTAVPLSETANARLETPRGTATAKTSGAPMRSLEGDVVVISGSYMLPDSDRTVANLAGDGSTITLIVGGEEMTFPVVRGDVME